MCGIVGIAGPHEPKWVEEMNEAIVHRGPDDRGIYSSPDGSVSLAMRRLSILDLEGGQPADELPGYGITFGSYATEKSTMRLSCCAR